MRKKSISLSNFPLLPCTFCISHKGLLTQWNNIRRLCLRNTHLQPLSFLHQSTIFGLGGPFSNWKTGNNRWGLGLCCRPSGWFLQVLVSSVSARSRLATPQCAWALYPAKTGLLSPVSLSFSYRWTEFRHNLRKEKSHELGCRSFHLNFRGGFSPLSIHCIVSGSWCRIYVPSIVTMREKTSSGLSPVVRIITSRQDYLQRCPKILAKLWLGATCPAVWGFSIPIARANLFHVQMVMRNVADSFLANTIYHYLIRRSSRTTFLTFWIFSSVTVVFGRPDLGSSFSDFLPCLNSRLQRFMVAIMV